METEGLLLVPQRIRGTRRRERPPEEVHGGVQALKLQGDRQRPRSEEGTGFRPRAALHSEPGGFSRSEEEDFLAVQAGDPGPPGVQSRRPCSGQRFWLLS